MSFFNLDDLPIVSVAGFTLNTEERASLQASLVLLRDAENFHTVALWGKILGIQKDYLIAQAIAGEDLFKRKLFYSTDALTWLQLPELSAEELKQTERVHARFLGDPAYEYTVPAEEEGGAEKTLVEEKRLAGTVRLIEQDAAVVPRGAYYKDATGKLRINPSFAGLAAHEISRLESYFHFREGYEITQKTIAERENAIEESIDIFESISKDEPKGVWSLKLERQGTSVILRSLLWPGYTFFHAPAGNGPQHPFYSAGAAGLNPLQFSNVGGAGAGAKFGALYFGTGQRNVNIGFML